MEHPKRRWPRWLAELLAVIAVVVAINAWHLRDAPSGPAPDFTGVLLDGTGVTLSELRGSPLLLHFWATWCPICGLQQGSIDAIAKDHTVLTVAIDADSPAAIESWMARQGVSYPVVHDPEYRLAGQYGIRGVPASFILDSAGNIRFAESGYSTGIGLRARLWWAGL
jgi:peroxiredoxin